LKNRFSRSYPGARFLEALEHRVGKKASLARPGHFVLLFVFTARRTLTGVSATFVPGGAARK
jgi:hypothetical protein